MSTEAALLHAITANRADNTARLVYADWLDEQGGADRAAYLRLQVELVREWWYNKPCTELYARIADLSKRLDPAWLATVRRCTTPAPPVNVEEIFPELRDKAKTAVRLHPRPGKAPTDVSKIGGMFLWPKKEPWPVCESCNVPYVTALQLRKEDVPELDFPPDADLFQLLWCPSSHSSDDSYCPRPAIFWRNRATVGETRKQPPRWKERHELYDEDEDALLTLCRIYPEQVIEYPTECNPFWLIDGNQPAPTAFHGAVEMVLRLSPIRELSYPADSGDLYSDWLSESCGTKIGGFPHWNNVERFPRCECGAEMEYLLSFASQEYDAVTWGRWVPIEDRPTATASEFREWGTVCEPLGCMFGRCMTMNVFACRKHSNWPARASLD